MEAKHLNNPAHCCSCCEFRSNNELDMIKHMKNKHARKDSMTEDELRNMITESFNVFQDYMKIKMQPTGAGSEEMIEDSIHAFKCYMLNQINE